MNVCAKGATLPIASLHGSAALHPPPGPAGQLVSSRTLRGGQRGVRELHVATPGSPLKNESRALGWPHA